mmetsp:Transcript_9755/g.36329  ORF Transcript_9755/g.36329 Transcript_9755/m.36329 type:complete len:494 (+) Transcript_9755:88-1569(+)
MSLPPKSTNASKVFGDMLPSERVNLLDDLHYDPNDEPELGKLHEEQSKGSEDIASKLENMDLMKKNGGEDAGNGGAEDDDEKKNSLYDANMSFKDMTKLGLHENVLLGLHDKGFNKPSGIQARSLPVILTESVNLIAQSQSGTGKTCCFGIALIQSADTTKNVPQAICVAPTLELADQTYQVVQALGKHVKGLKIMALLKGMKVTSAITDHIVIGTPGKIADIIKRKYLNINGIKLFVLDEADELLVQNTRASQNHVLQIVRSIQRVKPRVLLFSATYKEEAGGFGSEEDRQQEAQILEFAKEVVPEPRNFILIPKESLTLDNMRQFYVVCDSPQDKVNVLAKIYETLEVGQCIIFLNRIDYAENLYKAMTAAGHKISLLHGRLTSEERRDVINKFRDNINKVLISTNVLSRGLDVRTVTHVINFELPVERNGSPDYSTYLHRIGRTARFGDLGVAVNFVETATDQKHIEMIEQYFKTEIVRVEKDQLEEQIA